MTGPGLCPANARILDRAIARWAQPWWPRSRRPFLAALAACKARVEGDDDATPEKTC